LEHHLQQAGKRRAVDTRRVVFAGVSDGGSGALWLAAHLPALRSGALRGVAVWSTDPSVLESRGAVLDPTLLKGIPVRWTAGGRDRLYPVSDVTNWWARFRTASVPLESRLDPEADHDMAWHQHDFGRFPAWAKLRLR
jgi:dienelactone hydrolase